MRHKSFLAIMLLLVPLWSQAGSFNIGIDTIAVEQGNASLILIVDSPLDMEDANPGDGLCATAMATCTLRAAVEESNAYPGPDSITLPARTYIVSSNLPVTDDLSVVGEHKNTTIIDANGADFAFVTIPPTSDVTIESVTVQGSTQAGIDIPFGSLSLIASRVRDNSGYGVRCDSVDGIETVNILNSEISANGLDGV
jgi:hypothetical protein